MQHDSPEPSSGRAESVMPVFLRMPTVMRMTGLGRSTIYRLIADRKFPSPVRLGPRDGARFAPLVEVGASPRHGAQAQAHGAGELAIGDQPIDR